MHSVMLCLVAFFLITKDPGQVFLKMTIPVTEFVDATDCGGVEGESGRGISTTEDSW